MNTLPSSVPSKREIHRDKFIKKLFPNKVHIHAPSSETVSFTMRKMIHFFRVPTLRQQFKVENHESVFPS